MKLKGEYKLHINVELPNGTLIPMQNLIDFFYEDNYEVISNLTQYPDMTYFDATSYGCITTEANYKWLRDYFIEVGYVAKSNDEILNREELINTLRLLSDWAEDYLNNSKEYIRQVKIDMLNEEK